MPDKKKNKIDFKKKKENTLYSLREVECFLNRTFNLKKAGKIAKLFKK